MRRQTWRASGRAAWAAAQLAALIIGASLMLFPALASAQIADAVIEVLAQDESKAMLPGVTVTVTAARHRATRRPA